MALINKTGITDGGLIEAEHITRIIDALTSVSTDTIVATGSFQGTLDGTAALANTASYITTAQTASYILNAVSASFASNAFFGVSASYADNSVFGVSASLAQTAKTASYVLNAVSASFATTASSVLSGVTASFATSASQAISSSRAITASFATSAATASFIVTAQTASYVLNAVSASFATSASRAVSASFTSTASFVTPLNQSVIITGSLNLTGSLQVSQSINFINSASLPVGVGATAVYAGGYASPNIGRLFIGDGTGWQFHFSRRALTNTTDIVTITDKGQVLIFNSSASSAFRVAGDNNNPAIFSGVGAGLFAGTTPKYSLESNLSSGAYNHLLVMRGSEVSFAAATRRNGIVFKMSNESDENESSKMGAVYLESTLGWSNNPSLCFATYNAERMRIDLDGNVGIGTTNPLAKLDVHGSVLVTTGSLQLNTGNANTNQIAFVITDNSATSRGFYVVPNIAGVSNYFSLSAAGDVGIIGSTGENLIIGAGNGAAWKFLGTTGGVGDGTMYTLANVGIGNNSPTFKLQLGANSAAKPGGGSWSDSSDERLKENIELADLDLCYDVIKNLPLKRYRWKDNSYTDEQIIDRNVVGWIAQDVAAVFPKAVSEKPFTQVDGTTIDDCLTLNETLINRTLYGAVQKLITENETLKSELQAIKTHLGL